MNLCSWCLCLFQVFSTRRRPNGVSYNVRLEGLYTDIYGIIHWHLWIYSLYGHPFGTPRPFPEPCNLGWDMSHNGRQDTEARGMETLQRRREMFIVIWPSMPTEGCIGYIMMLSGVISGTGNGNDRGVGHPGVGHPVGHCLLSSIVGLWTRTKIKMAAARLENTGILQPNQPSFKYPHCYQRP